MRHLLLIAALIATGLLPGGETANATTAAAATNLQAPSAAEVDAAMLAAVRAEFPMRDVRVRLASSAIEDDAGPAQRGVSARGRVLLDGSDRWIPFRATALYDMQSATAMATSLELAEPARASNLVDASLADDRLAQTLRAAASRKLHEEFASQRATLQLDRVQVREAGDYLALLADGRADFGAEGTADATIRALYDPRNGRWLRLDYELGEGG
jgi:hypothetical protein